MSKTKPLEYVTAALAAGQHDFGENYIQELQEKSAALADNKDVKYGPSLATVCATPVVRIN